MIMPAPTSPNGSDVGVSAWAMMCQLQWAHFYSPYLNADSGPFVKLPKASRQGRVGNVLEAWPPRTERMVSWACGRSEAHQGRPSD